MSQPETREKFINPFTDFGFKKLFGSEPDKELLVDFLNELLQTKAPIKDLRFKKTDQLGSTDSDRKAIFDLYCENERGEKFIVELQKVKQQFFKDRSLYYATFPIQEQAQKGDWNYQLRTVYCVGILDFAFDDKDKDKLVVDEIALMSRKTGKAFYDKLAFVYVQMPNFTKTEEELETQLDKWLYLLKNLHKFERIPAKLQERIFRRAFEIAEIARYSDDERQSYRDSLKHYLDLKNSFDSVREEAKNERDLEIALIFIKKGYDNQTIKDGTGLTDEQIDQLRRELEGGA